MSRRGSDRFATTAALVLAFASSAHAQQAAPSPTQLAAALTQRNAGLAHMRDGYTALAVEAFERSLSLVESPNTRLDLARALEATGHLARALHEFERARDAAQARADAGRSEYELTAQAAREQADALRPRVPTLQVRFTGSPPPRGSVVLIADAEIPASAATAPVAVDAGRLTVRLAGPAVREASGTIAIRPGDHATIDLPVHSLAFVRVGDASLAPGTQLTLDGHALDLTAALAELTVEPGPHRLERVRPHGVHVERLERDVAPGAHVTLDFPFEHSTPVDASGRRVDEAPVRLIASLAAASVGVVAAGVGLGLWVASDQTFHSLQDACHAMGCDASHRPAVDQGQTLETVGVVLMVSGGVVAAGGLALLGWDRTHASERPRVTPVVGLGALGVRVEL